MTMTRLPVPTFDDITAAAQRLQGIAHRTPVLRSTSADESTGAHIFFKCENLQRTGAFKFRGAFNTLAQFTDEQRERGVLAFSAGNHAQAIALSARMLDMPAVIVMPADAPASKMAATRAYGAQVVTYDRYTEDREAISQRLAQERGMTLVPPYDHPDVMAGQGTAALELLTELGITQSQIMKKIEEIDLRDGKLDEKLSQPTECADCGHRISKRRTNCFYCGSKINSFGFKAT